MPLEGLVFIGRRRRHVGGRLGQVRHGLGGWMVAPRSSGIEIGGERGTDLLRDGLAGELGGPLLIERLHHAEDDEHRIDGLPAARLIVEQAELGGKRVGFADVGVDAAGVVLEEAAILRGEAGGEPLRSLPELEHALDAVMLDEVAAENFRDFAGSDAAHHVHLPETVLRGDVALCGDQVVDAGGGDVGDALVDRAGR